VTSVLPSAAEIRQIVAKYIDDSEAISQDCLAIARSSESFRSVYQVSLAAHTVLGGLSSRSLRPSLNRARSIALRIPLLVSMGQSGVAQAELRRFVELVFWAIYFTDHPVEWKTFLGKASGFARDQRKPISYAAHRELAFYLDYALELMEPEPSGLGATAVNNSKQVVYTLNTAVHAGNLARIAGRLPPHDDVSEIVLRKFLALQRNTFSNCSLLLAAYRRSKFDGLNALARAHFDWLVGSRIRREVRKGPFGLQ
jgi:hypothetical protein